MAPGSNVAGFYSTLYGTPSPHVYSTPGATTVTDYIQCGCGFPSTDLGQVQRNVQIITPPPPMCIHHGTPTNGSLSGDSNLPDNGTGYYHFLGSDPQNTDDWACSNWAITKVTAVGLWWNQTPRIGIGDLSRQGGGSFLPHTSHQNGLDVDARYFRMDGQEAPLNLATQPGQHNVAKSQQVVNRFARQAVPTWYSWIRVPV
jgi:murein endopeptidase